MIPVLEQERHAVLLQDAAPAGLSSEAASDVPLRRRAEAPVIGALHALGAVRGRMVDRGMLATRAGVTQEQVDPWLASLVAGGYVRATKDGQRLPSRRRALRCGGRSS